MSADVFALANAGIPVPTPGAHFYCHDCFAVIPPPGDVDEEVLVDGKRLHRKCAAYREIDRERHERLNAIAARMLGRSAA